MYPLLAALEFEHPLRLIWLAIAPVIVYFAIRSRTSAPTGRRAASLICRLLILTLAILAFAGLVRRGPSEQRFVVFATDVSRSVAGGGRQAAEQFIQSALQQQGGHEAAFIPFAGKPGAVATEPQFTGETLDVNSSDPAAALQLAAATIPADFVPQVVLLTDGNETGGDLARAALGVGVPVAVVPLPAFADPEVCVTDLLAPAEVAPGADVPCEVVIQANLETTGTLELLRDGEPSPHAPTWHCGPARTGSACKRRWARRPPPSRRAWRRNKTRSPRTISAAREWLPAGRCECCWPTRNLPQPDRSAMCWPRRGSL